jgi:GR25 family glycosyltransferase involved in LPS biosynthesis/SAM-dependent methyltransferase
MEFLPVRDLAAVYVLNLARRPDRLGRFLTAAAAAGLTGTLEPQRVDAVDGKFLPGFRKDASPAEAACTMGHRYMWGLAARFRKPVLIMEDDAVLSRNFPRHLNELLNLPCDLDVLQLGMSWLKLHPGAGPLRRPKSGWGTFAYVVFPSGAKKLLKAESITPLKPADTYLYPSSQMKVLLPYPMWATLRGQDSDIAGRAPEARRMGRHFEDDVTPQKDPASVRAEEPEVRLQLCPVCEMESIFEPFGNPRRSVARCGWCGTLERHRLLWLYLNAEGLLNKKLRVIHFAPEPALRARFTDCGNWTYATAGMDGKGVTHRIDLQNMRLPDASQDLIVCSHVLEHVPDDRRAMRELYRILAPGGTALIMVPVRREQPTIEDFRIKTAEERLKYFGQRDHVRWYGMDITERLRTAGFEVHDHEFAERFNSSQSTRYGLIKEPLFVCRK